MTTAAVAPPESTPASSGLEWTCRLLWGGSEHVHAGSPGSAPPGFRMTEAYLVLPRAANPRLLVPLGSPRAAAAALSRNHDATSRRSRLAKAALSAAVRVRLAQRLLPHRVVVSVAGGLGPGDLGRALLSEHLGGVFSRPDLEMAVIVGTPRPNRKPVLQVLSPAGDVLGYVKVAWNDLTLGLVRNEAAMLEHLRAAPPRSFAAPAVLHHGPWGGLELLAASALPHTLRPEQGQVFDPPLTVIGEVARLGGISRVPLGDSPYWTGVRARLAARAKALAGTPDPLAGIVSHVEARHGATELDFGAWHGDFTPWNMARLDEGIFVWDWERSGPAPVGLDLLHFLFQSTCRFEGRNPAESVEMCRERTPRLLALLEVPPASEEALWSVYRMEILFRYDEARRAGVLERQSRIHRGVVEMFESEMEAR